MLETQCASHNCVYRTHNCVYRSWFQNEVEVDMLDGFIDHNNKWQLTRVCKSLRDNFFRKGNRSHITIHGTGNLKNWKLGGAVLQVVFKQKCREGYMFYSTSEHLLQNYCVQTSHGTKLKSPEHCSILSWFSQAHINCLAFLLFTVYWTLILLTVCRTSCLV